MFFISNEIEEVCVWEMTEEVKNRNRDIFVEKGNVLYPLRSVLFRTHFTLIL